ncbi:hypothetical protein ACFQER_06170 [Halomicroarcula sp. GCM10025894]
MAADLADDADRKERDAEQEAAFRERCVVHTAVLAHTPSPDDGP